MAGILSGLVRLYIYGFTQDESSALRWFSGISFLWCLLFFCLATYASFTIGWSPEEYGYCLPFAGWAILLLIFCGPFLAVQLIWARLVRGPEYEPAVIPPSPAGGLPRDSAINTRPTDRGEEEKSTAPANATEHPQSEVQQQKDQGGAASMTRQQTEKPATNARSKDIRKATSQGKSDKDKSKPSDTERRYEEKDKKMKAEIAELRHALFKAQEVFDIWEQARIIQKMGLIYFSNGDYENTIAALRQAVAIYRISVRRGSPIDGQDILPLLEAGGRSCSNRNAFNALESYDLMLQIAKTPNDKQYVAKADWAEDCCRTLAHLEEMEIDERRRARNRAYARDAEPWPDGAMCGGGKLEGEEWRYRMSYEDSVQRGWQIFQEMIEKERRRQDKHYDRMRQSAEQYFDYIVGR